jgi:hypothetical protein
LDWIFDERVNDELWEGLESREEAHERRARKLS